MVANDRTKSPWRTLKHILLGAPIHSSRAIHERLGVGTGLPVFASDALSSCAYATEAILSVLILGSVALAGLQIWIAAAISLLIAIVAWSYWQTIHAYPGGGGSYIVASDNLGAKPGMVAGAALLIDYVLTVSVSVAAGVAALVSAFPAIHAYLVPIGVACIGFIAFANLRGVRESGTLFALPTYAFLLSVFVMLGFAAARATQAPAAIQQIVGEPGAIGSEAAFPLVFLIARAFAAGCTALTGIEAVSNGVPAFKKPEAANASKTLVIMAVLLTVLFLGIGACTLRLPYVEMYATRNPGYSTLLSQIAGWAFGGSKTLGYFFVQFSTAAILILAANTAFADFPRLVSLLSRDGYLPRPLARLGDRLVFQNGIVFLAVAAAGLMAAYHGELDQLLPLYAVGVFLAFTLSQSGMVVHWLREKTKGHGLSISVNLVGATATGIVTIILFVTKFSEGAWLVLLLLTAIYGGFRAVKSRYSAMARELATGVAPIRPLREAGVVVLVPRIHRGVIRALEYATALGTDARAIHVDINPATTQELIGQWEAIAPRVPLIVIESPYRSLLDPILAYVDAMRADKPDYLVTVVIPEAVATRWSHRILQENLAAQLKSALGRRRNVVVSNVRYFLK